MSWQFANIIKGELFNENFRKYADEASEEVLKAGPVTK